MCTLTVLHVPYDCLTCTLTVLYVSADLEQEHSVEEQLRANGHNLALTVLYVPYDCLICAMTALYMPYDRLICTLTVLYVPADLAEEHSAEEQLCAHDGRHLKRCKGFHLKAKARIWPCLSYM